MLVRCACLRGTAAHLRILGANGAGRQHSKAGLHKEYHVARDEEEGSVDIASLGWESIAKGYSGSVGEGIIRWRGDGISYSRYGDSNYRETEGGGGELGEL